MPRPPSLHGTRSRYARGCRCEPCRDANAAYVTRWRHRTGRTDPARAIPAGTMARHGTETRHRYGCRCEACRAANAKAQGRRWRARAAEARTSS